MNVFGILSSDDEETLTEENYCEKTNKDKPYYRPDISPISPYFAICPRCKNPIQIINLYKNTMEENITGEKDCMQNTIHKVYLDWQYLIVKVLMLVV